MISIIIPTLNEEKLLPRLLEDIKKQTYTDYEIIVADANSTDRTREIAEQFGSRVTDGGLPGVGRNNGAKIARGEYFIFFDSDITIKEDFLENAFNEFQEKYLDVATCSYFPDSDEYKNWFDVYNSYARVVQFIRPSCGGAFIFTTRRMFERIEGFDESLKLAEDHNFVKRASKYGKFRILESVSLILSVRRFDKEGIIKFVSRALQSEIHRSFFGEIKNDRFKYELGNYNVDKKSFMKQKSKLKKIILQFKKTQKERAAIRKTKKKSGK